MIESSFISNGREGKRARGQEGKRARGQDSIETERERGRENEHWAAAGIASVVNGPLENTHV